MTEFPVNIVRSPSDDRDWLVSSFLTQDTESLPSVFRCDGLMPVRNQGSQGTCAAQSAACMKEWQEFKDYDFNEYMSPQFVYNNRSNPDSPGMHCRDVMRILEDIGIVGEKEYTYESFTPMEEGLLLSAKLHLISGYARVFTVTELKRSLMTSGPCLIAFPVYNHGVRMWYEDGTARQGGHAMTVVGYDVKGFIIRNSWGAKWGDGGHCIYPYEDWGSHWEIWSTVDASSDVDPNPLSPSDDNEEAPDTKCPCFVL